MPRKTTAKAKPVVKAASASAPGKTGPFAAVAAAFTRTRGVTLAPGWGEGNLTLQRDGKIFVMITGVGFVAKLPRARVDQLVEEGAGTRFDPRKNGRVMNEWLVVASTHDEAEWLALAREAYAFAKDQAAAKPKPRAR
jgi:hypothetical protein